MNSMQVKDKLKNIAKEKKVDFNRILKFYVFDRFIARLSKSKYKDNFIIKGGFLLSILFGLENRSTMDIDSEIANTNLTEFNILKMMTSIVGINLDDNVKFSIKRIETIKDDDEYGGYRIHLLFEFENVKEFLKLDIATGDPITPNAISCKYKMMLDDNYIDVWSYNLETILAEKIETVFSKAEVSSRMKDYYDIYLICSKDWNNLNCENFRKAVENTFHKRNFDKDLFETYQLIKNSSILRKRWEVYSRKYEYARNINYDDIMNSLEKIIEIILPVSVDYLK